jgi:hypothetical protein
MPVDERLRSRLNGEIRLGAWIGLTQFGIAIIDQHPKPPIDRPLFRKHESDHYPAIGQGGPVSLHLAPGPQRIRRIGLFCR